MRCIAPFWRGLEDFHSEWTEYQLVAAAKGLPIPPPDQIPSEVEAPLPGESPTTNRQSTSTAGSGSLTVPIQGRSDSAASDASANIAKILSSSENTHTSSLIRPRSKTIASLTSKSPSQNETMPREIHLPVDPNVNGLRVEAFLYKDAIECPICFIYYPPYLNQTRCCDQPICSECFVQIKRPDPHPPEHADPSDPATPPAENPETLVSEPANCPYCQQPEFGVTYDPPPFRRGLAYANMNSQTKAAMSASDSTPNNGSSSSLRPAGSRRRAASVSANASNVVTTDKIRPDWATKLANARNHAARRSAAATALHTAAYLMGNGSGMEGRGFGFGGRSRFGRARDSPGSSSPAGGPDGDARLAALNHLAAHHDQRHREGQADGRRRSRMDDLEDMMMMEAIRLSIAAEEERKRKEEKEKAKEAKKKAKEQKKADKAADKQAAKNGIYGGSSSRTASALSLVLPGRRRGNSGSSAMAREANNYSIDHTYPSHDANDKGKGKEADRTGSSSSHAHPYPTGMDGTSSQAYGQHLTPDESVPAMAGISSAAAMGVTPDRPSHLRQISSASSPSSSYIESAPGSIHRGQGGFQASASSFESPSASNTELGRLGHSRDASRDRDQDPGSAGDEPMFNFRSLAEIVGREDEKDGYENTQVEYADENQRPVSKAGPSQESIDKGENKAEQKPKDPFGDQEELMDQSVTTIRPNDYERAVEQKIESNTSNSHLTASVDTPELMVTPVTPALGDGEGKQLGH